jgi:probable F420-dependent oxidoreductase
VLLQAASRQTAKRPISADAEVRALRVPCPETPGHPRARSPPRYLLSPGRGESCDPLCVREFRFGVHVLAPSGHDEWISLVQRAEGLGYSVLTVPDHLIDGCISPLAALGVAAEATATLRVGTLVLNNDLRHPALVAREALALDSLSGGRFELGLGAGSQMSSPEYESVGLRFDDGATRVARLAEAIDALDGLLRGNDVTLLGDHYRLEAHRAWPPPTQSPRPPVLVGGNGRRILRIAAERADIVSLSGIGRAGFSPSPEAVDERIALVRAAAGRRDVELQALVQRVIITDDPRGSAEGLRESIPGLGVDDVLATPYLWIGTVDSICEGVLAARERWGFSYFSVFHDALVTVAPVVARLAGT